MTGINEGKSLTNSIEKDAAASTPKYERSYHFDHRAFDAFLNRNPATYFKGSVMDARISPVSTVVDYLDENPEAMKPSCADRSTVASEAMCSLQQEDKITIYLSKSAWQVEVTSGNRFNVGAIPLEVCQITDRQE